MILNFNLKILIFDPGPKICKQNENNNNNNDKFYREEIRNDYVRDKRKKRNFCYSPKPSSLITAFFQAAP